MLLSEASKRNIPFVDSGDSGKGAGFIIALAVIGGLFGSVVTAAGVAGAIPPVAAIGVDAAIVAAILIIARLVQWE